MILDATMIKDQKILPQHLEHKKSCALSYLTDGHVLMGSQHQLLTCQ